MKDSNLHVFRSKRNMSDNYSVEGPRGSNQRIGLKSETDNVDSVPRPSYKRFQKNTICQEKKTPFDGQIRNRSLLSGAGKTNSRTELQALRLSKKNLPVSERMKGYFHDSVDQVRHGSNMMESQCVSSRNNSVVSSKCRKKCVINEDWGKRTELHNIFNVNDGDKVWNIIRRGLFAEIKLWKNGYGSLSCKATGQISVKGIHDKSIIEINTKEHLRKLLDLSHMQWSALCEALDEKDIALTFNAFEEVDIKKKSSLEKLWFFICKRRHFLPNICVMGKLSGAVKLMKELQIMPKIIVTGIRNFKGEEID